MKYTGRPTNTAARPMSPSASQNRHAGRRSTISGCLLNTLRPIERRRYYPYVPKITKRGILKRAIGYPVAFGVAILALWLVSIRMPGKSFDGPLPPLGSDLRASSQRLRAHVDMLAGRIGERNYMRMRALDSAANYIHQTLASQGYEVVEQTFVIDGKTFRNIEASRKGISRPSEIVVVGGHYDSVYGTPGADDNASGTAG